MDIEEMEPEDFADLLATLTATFDQMRAEIVEMYNEDEEDAHEIEELIAGVDKILAGCRVVSKFLRTYQ